MQVCRVVGMLLLCSRALGGAVGIRAGGLRVRPLVARARAPRASVALESSAGLTLDERLVAEEPETVRTSLRRRQASEEVLGAVDRIGELTRERAALVEVGNAARAQRKALSPKIGALLKAGDDGAVESLKAEVAVASEEAAAADAKMEVIETERDALFATLPNLLDARTPNGADEQDNQCVFEWGTEGPLPMDRVWHDEAATKLGGLDVEAAAKLAGSRFAVLRGPIARMERAIANFFLDLHTEKHGYREVNVPFLVGADALKGTGQLPKFHEDLFRLAEPLNGRQAYLIPTAEVPITNLHAGEILDEAALPISYVGYTPCFRAEAGSHGKDTRGLFRQHQFYKVELVKITTPEQSDAEHRALVAHAEECLKRLKLPYRKMLLCGGDIGFSAQLCYDLEGKFREISSCSNCGSFQARRMNLRYRPSAAGTDKKQKPVHCHTINGSGLAVGRTLVAILENYQNEDGSITVPEVLRPYMGGMERIQAE